MGRAGGDAPGGGHPGGGGARRRPGGRRDGSRPTIRLPHTFNSGGAGGSYTGDIGTGSGCSLREDYGSPEDLYEDDGTYSDLDKAIDEWEEGW